MNTLSACPHCDLLIQRMQPPPNHKNICPRCGYVLERNHPGSLDKTLALCITGLLLFIPAIFLPLITMEKLGMSEHANVLETIIRLYEGGYYFVSGMTLLSAVIFPATLLCLVFVVSMQLKLRRISSLTPGLFRAYVHLEEWAMVEVYLFGVLVAIFKMAGMAAIIFNAGFYSFIGLVFVTLGICVVLDKSLFWEMIDTFSPKMPSPADAHVSEGGWKSVPTAAQAGFASCLTCGKLHALRDMRISGLTRCRRCGDRLHLRKPHSLSRTLALVTTSALLLLPANLLPIMQVDFLGVSDKSTILDGIIYFFEEGSYLIGLIIMIASILVPLFKIVGLGILLSSTSLKLPYFLKQKSTMFRFITFIGRWSMLDIFVIALLVSLVDFGFFTSIQAAPAATFFCLVVATTMLAATAFDPRIMWDNCRPRT